MTCYRSLMLNTHVTSDALISIAVEAHAKAAAHLEACAKRVREHGAGPLADIYADDLDRAFEAFELACDEGHARSSAPAHRLAAWLGKLSMALWSLSFP